MIDLHTHTTASDGTDTPAELVAMAARLPLRTLAITDHDTFAGHDEAAPLARRAGLELICGIELNTRLERPGLPEGKTVHLLAYWFAGAPDAAFRRWLAEMQASRRDRNERLARRLREMGVEVHLEEVEAIGHAMTGRPHFARVLMAKGYTSSMEEAFRRYLGEAAPGYVWRQSPSVAEAIARVRESGGVPSLAHPIRLGLRPLEEQEAVATLADEGLMAIEAYHSDHTAVDRERFLHYARDYHLHVTGGSDHHGANKPHIGLGTGCNHNLQLPGGLMEPLRGLTPVRSDERNRQFA